MWPISLSTRLPIAGTVGHYPTVYLMGRNPIPYRKTFPKFSCGNKGVFGISSDFSELSQSKGQVGYVLLTRSPLYSHPKVLYPFDLHVLSMPPAFILSQDQTLRPNKTSSENQASKI